MTAAKTVPPHSARDRFDTNGCRRPNVQIGMAERTRLDGTRFLLGVVGEELTIEAGSSLRLERIARTEAEGAAGCTFALVVSPPVTPWSNQTKAEREQAVRLDGLGIRMTAEQETP